jgi:hypothetical protein
VLLTFQESIVKKFHIFSNIMSETDIFCEINENIG